MEIKLRIGSIILGTTINIYSIEVALSIFSTSIRFSESPTSMNISQIIAINLKIIMMLNNFESHIPK